MRIRNSLELTLAILKPDLLLHPLKLKLVKQKIIDEKFWIIRWKILQWTRSEAEQFYEEHQERFFYKRLTSFMSSGPIMPLILARENAINHWRTLMGPTKTTMAKLSHPDSIRALYGLTDTRNATHGSDSSETATREIKYFFPEFDIHDWFQNDMKAFQNGLVWFNNDEEIHRITHELHKYSITDDSSS